MAKQELKPCPHCCGKPEGWCTWDVPSEYGYKDTYMAKCSECGYRTIEFDTKKEAIEVWNCRVDGKGVKL